MKTFITFICLLFLHISLHAQTIIFQEKFDGMPSYSLTGWLYSFTGVVPWQCGLPFTVGPCMIPLGAAMAENTGTNKVACFAECHGTDRPDSNVLAGSPYINMTPVSGAWLKYDSYFAGYTSMGHTEKATVEISTDSGATWTILEHVAPSAPQGLFNTHYIDLAAYDHIGSIRIGFRYNDDGGAMMGWAIDNVTVFIPAHKDIALKSVTPTDSLLSYTTLGRSFTHSVNIYNNGLDTIHTFILNYKQDNGTIMTNTFTGLNIGPFSTATFTHPIRDTVFSIGRHTVQVWASLDSDTYHINDSAKTYISGADFIPSKKLAIESGEGAYNGWSPRNMYYLRSVPGLDIASCRISVHEFDPMVDTIYHDFMFNLGWNYVPYILFDRRTNVPLDSFFYYLNVQKEYFGFADVVLYSFLSGTDVVVNTTIFPAITMTGDFRLAMILTEDGVTGTTIDYDQANNYAGGGLGPMGGYESLPNPIPAADMTYNFVARLAYPTPDGVPAMLPSTLTAGQSYSYSFTAPLNPMWNTAKLKAKVLLIRHGDSTILNSNEVNFPVVVTDINKPLQDGGVYPNPAQDLTKVYFSINRNETVHITFTDITGKVIHSVPNTNYNAGRNEVDIPVQKLANGVYIVNILSEDGNKSMKLEVMH